MIKEIIACNSCGQEVITGFELVGHIFDIEAGKACTAKAGLDETTHFCTGCFKDLMFPGLKISQRRGKVDDTSL